MVFCHISRFVLQNRFRFWQNRPNIKVFQFLSVSYEETERKNGKNN